ncbi:hypothetical protein FOA52_010418 [Chlamydomonas sp. UWO 241]|nr:hypothetical protein FOA52_010418 [Chlamydomonas sp. UWO 241]
MECLGASATSLGRPLSSRRLRVCSAAGGRRSPVLGSSRLAAPQPQTPLRRAGGHAASSRQGRRLGSSACHALPDAASAEAARRRTYMLRWVRECDPKDAVAFVDSGKNPAVVAAMRHTVANIVGTLPSNFFEVKVSTVADSLAQLFYTMAMTGYLFSSAQYRMELRAVLDSIQSVPSPARRTVGDGNSSSSSGGSAVGSGGSSIGSSRGSLGGGNGAAAALAAGSTDGTLSHSSSDSDEEGAITPTTTALVAAGFGSQHPVLMALMGEDAKFAPGTQKRDIGGKVLRWHLVDGLQAVDASDYITALEAQNAALREALAQAATQAGGTQGGQPPRRGAAPGAADPFDMGYGMPTPTTAGATAAAATAAAAAAGGSGELLEFLRGLPSDSLCELTAGASPEVLDAIDAFVFRLMGTSDKAQLKEMSSEFSAAELSKVLMWLLIVGYALRTAEVKLEALTFRDDGGSSDASNGHGGGGFGDTPVGGVLGLGPPGGGGNGGKGKPNWGGGLSGWRRFLPGA